MKRFAEVFRETAGYDIQKPPEGSMIDTHFRLLSQAFETYADQFMLETRHPDLQRALELQMQVSDGIDVLSRPLSG